MCVNIPAVLRMPVPGCCLDCGPYIGTGTTFPGFGPTTDHPRDTSGLWTKPRIEAVPVTRGAAAVYCVAVRRGSGAAHHEQDRGARRVEHHLQGLRCGG